MKNIIGWALVVICIVAFLGLFYKQREFERMMLEHWHYSPKYVSVSLTTPKLSENVGYFLTKPKPKWQTQSQGYIFWSYNCGSKRYDVARPR